MRNTTTMRRILNGAAAFALAFALGACADQPMEVETPPEVQMDGQNGSGDCYMLSGVWYCPG